MSENLDGIQRAVPLVVHGKNIGVEWPPERIREQANFLSDDSIITAFAFGETMLTGEYADIILSTGYTSGRTVPSEAQALLDFAKSEFPGIEATDCNIHMEEDSLDTRSNVLQVRDRYASLTSQGIDLMTVGFHIPRTKMLFERLGVKVHKVIPSESILEQYPEKYGARLDRWRGEPRYKKEERKEWVARQLMIVDRTGRLLNAVTSKTRG